jgi:hypothetical protein
MSNQFYRRQHIVPKYYLRRFANQGRKTHVFAYDRFNDKSFTVNIDKICVSSKFYDIPIEYFPELKEKKHPEEILLKPFDEKGAQVLNSVFDEIVRFDSLDAHKYIYGLSLLVAMQIIRTPSFRNNYKSLVLNSPELDISKRIQFQSKYGSSEIELLPRVMQFYALKDPNISLFPISNTLFNEYYFELQVNTTSSFLYTSDNPIVVNANSQDGYFDNLRLDRKDRIVYYPLSPAIVLKLEKRQIITPIIQAEIKMTNLNEDQVEYINKLQFAQSDRWVISCVNNFV